VNVRAAVDRLLVLVDLAVGVAAAVVLTNVVRLRTRVPRADPSAVVYEDPTIVRITFIVCLVVITPFVAYRMNRARSRARSRRRAAVASPASTPPAGPSTTDG
jgi:hypothetical protein